MAVRGWTMAVRVLDRVRAPTARTLLDRRQRIGLLLVLPSVFLILGTLLYPLAYSLVISFYDLHVTMPWLPPKFVGLENYTRALSDPYVRAAFFRTAFFAVLSISLGVPLSLVLATGLTRSFPGRGLVRAALILPWAIPGTVQGLIWARIYDPNYGALNGLLLELGIIDRYIPWLLQPQRALLLVLLANLWSRIPLMTLLYLAALQGIPSDLYEAAAIDGAGPWQRFRAITFPLLLPTTVVVLILTTIDAFALFDLVYVLTGGGPARSTEVIGFFLYQAAFQRLDYGYASALAWMTALVVAGLAVAYRRLARRAEGTWA